MAANCTNKKFVSDYFCKFWEKVDADDYENWVWLIFMHLLVIAFVMHILVPTVVAVEGGVAAQEPVPETNSFPIIARV